MPTLTPTKDTGGQAKASGLLYVEPDLVMTDDELAGLAPDVGMNVPFVMDVVSAMLAHERCGVHLYRSVAGRTNNPMLKRRYDSAQDAVLEAVTVLEGLVTSAGGNPSYVSPAARAAQGMDTKLLESTFALNGSLDVMTQEMAMLDAVLLAESMAKANWETFAVLAGQLPDGELKTSFQEAADEVGPVKDEGFTWAKETKMKMVLLQSESRMMTAVGAKAEELVETVKGWFSD